MRSLEEELELILGATKLDGSIESAKWHHADKAEHDFFWVGGECQHFFEVRIALRFIKQRFNEGLTSPSPYVRRLTQLSGLRYDAYEHARKEYLDKFSDEMLAGMTEKKWSSPDERMAYKAHFLEHLDKGLKQNKL